MGISKKGEVMNIEYWKINLEDERSNFVNAAFDKNLFKWKVGSTGKYIQPTFLGFGYGAMIGKLGDYLIFNGEDYHILSEKKFMKEYGNFYRNDTKLEI
jgi:hypothetical protein